MARSRDAVEKFDTQEDYINQLKMHIETRLRITLPDVEELPVALHDGVILCHIANHVKPRAVPSIHVPSPAVPKLNVAKCRRNVENFLLACRKMGVREDDLFTWQQVSSTPADPKPVLLAVVTLLNLTGIGVSPPTDYSKPSSCDLGSREFDLDEGTHPMNYPDLVPIEERELASAVATTLLQSPTAASRYALATDFESIFLITVLFGTILFLFLFPADAVDETMI
jgi:hypothetical protein